MLIKMNRRKFLSYLSCSCGGFILNSCTSAPITQRKQLSIVPEAKLNAQAAKIYEKSICSELSQHFKDEGLFFVGIDVINGMLSEINVTSPTGLREIENLSNKNVSDQVIEKLLGII